MPTLQQIYSSANSVYDQTGVDPAVITALARTEGPTVTGFLMSLGITTGAPSGAGSTRSTLGSASNEANQPSRFWAYTTGAEAAFAFKSYIQAVFPQAAPSLGNADNFFNAMRGTNYDVVYNIRGNPASGRNTAAENQYWTDHIGYAHQANQLYGASSPDFGGAGSPGGVAPGGNTGSGGGTASGGGGGNSGGIGGGSSNSGSGSGIGVPASVLSGFFNQAAGPIVVVAGGIFLILGLILWKGPDTVKVIEKNASTAAKVVPMVMP